MQRKGFSFFQLWFGFWFWVWLIPGLLVIRGSMMVPASRWGYLIVQLLIYFFFLFSGLIVTLLVLLDCLESLFIRWITLSSTPNLALLRLPRTLSLFFMLTPLSLMPPFSFQGRDYMMGLLQAYVDGKTTMSVHERKASIREFYGV